MSCTIRQARPTDIADLVRLCREMEVHYQGDEAIGAETIRQRLTQWFNDNRDSVMLVAVSNDQVVGHAVICPLFPAGDLSTAWFLKDIFVAGAARGQGIGEQLIKACAHETVRRNGSRLDLTVDAGNEGARALYESLGAQDTAKSYLRWEGNALQALSERSHEALRS